MSKTNRKGLDDVMNTSDHPNVRAGQFKAGADPRRNAGGRPKGLRNKLTSRFLSNLVTDFDKHGAKAIANARIADPLGYVKVIASVLPKEIEHNFSLTDMTNEDILAAIAALESFVDAGDAEDGADEAPLSH